MQIVLVRHGRPDSAPTASIRGHEIGQWVSRYNEVGIRKDCPPPAQVQNLAESSACVVASDLKRSVESAEWLASTRDVRIDPDLREAGLPDSMGLPVRLPPCAWMVIARLAWWVNVGRAAESVAATRLRASDVAEKLCSLAHEYGAVLVVGHGMFNRFLAAQLRRRGWKGPTLLPREYWGSARYVRRGWAV